MDYHSLVRQTAGPSEEEWALHRPLIAQLYRVEGRSLQEVMKVMADTLGFKASVKMYKTRVGRWGLDKKMKKSEMLWALRTLETRRRQGKPTQLVIRGLRVDETMVRKYFKRQKTTKTTDISLSENISTPPGITYGTPELKHLELPPATAVGGGKCLTADRSGLSYDLCNKVHQHSVNVFMSPKNNEYGPTIPSTMSADWIWPVNGTEPQLRAVLTRSPQLRLTPLATGDRWQPGSAEYHLSTPNHYMIFDSQHDHPCFISVPDTVALSQQTLQQVEQYLHRYFTESPCWTQYYARSTAHTTLTQDLHSDETFQNPSEMIGHFGTAVRLFTRKQAADAGMLLSSVFQNIELLLKQEHPQLLTSLLVLVACFGTSRWSALIHLLLDQFYELSSDHFGPSHHFTCVVSLLSKGLATGQDTASEALDALVSLCTAHTGVLHPVRLEAMYNHAWIMLRKRRYAEACFVLEDLRGIYATHFEEDNFMSKIILYSLMHAYRRLGDEIKAEARLKEMQDGGHLWVGVKSATELRLNCLRLQARLAKVRSDYNEMRRLGEMAWTIGIRKFSANDAVLVILEQDIPYHLIAGSPTA